MNGFKIDEAWLEGYDRIHFPKDSFLYWQNDPFTNYYFVLSGTVKDFLILPNGEEKLFFIAEGPYLSGSERNNYGRSLCRCCCFAITDVEAVCVPAGEMDSLILKFPALALAMFKIFNIKTTGIQNQAEETSLPVAERLAKFLIDSPGYGLLMNKFDSDVIHITHLNIARFIGSTRSHVTKCLAEFERCGMIAQDKHGIRILGRAALTKLAKVEVE